MSRAAHDGLEPGPKDGPGRARPVLARVVMTLAAWLVAFLIVTTLLTSFSDELQSLPLALRALVISGVLVALMVNLVMPVLSVAVARWLTRAPGPRVGENPKSPDPGEESSDEAIPAAL